jgi:NADP-dependent 3-hydroxy acid dehydrogenase YdfG
MGAGGLTGRSVVVTGASRGIGLAIAEAVAGAGARTFLLSRSAVVLSREAERIGPLARAVPCDLTSGADVERAATLVREEVGGAPDVLVQNAGWFTIAPVEATPPDDMERMLGANVTGPYRLLHAFLPGMRERGSGHVVHIGSVADRVAYAGNVAYAASKYATRAIHEVLREELRGSGVRASMVSPGPVDTQLWDQVPVASRTGLMPRSAMLRAAQVADAVLFVLTQSGGGTVDELRLMPA